MTTTTRAAALGANLADVAASVRCQSAPVAVTTEDPPTPAPE